MSYIVFDLEWNQASEKNKDNPGLTFEIIEIGAVKVDENGEVVDEFEGLIRPCVYPELFYRVREVVHLTTAQLMKKGKPFPEVLKDFMEWCGEDPVFCSWGSMDLTELQKNIVFFGLENPFRAPLYYYDIQKLYSLYYQDGKQRSALETVIEELGFRMGEPFHRAVSDAYYTALVLGALPKHKWKKMISVDYFRAPEGEKEQVYLVFDRYSKFVSRTFESREEAMKNPQVTATICYKCGCNVKRRLNWFSDNTRHYYSLSYCSNHGWLKGKIRAKKEIGTDRIFMIKTLKLVDQTAAADILCRQEALKTKRREKRLKEV